MSREPLPAKGHVFREPPPNIPLSAALLPSGCFNVFTLLMKPHLALFSSPSITHSRQPIARHLLSCDHFSHKKKKKNKKKEGLFIILLTAVIAVFSQPLQSEPFLSNLVCFTDLPLLPPLHHPRCPGPSRRGEHSNLRF